MSDKKMLIVPAEVVEKINANRGDMGQGEFINFLIDSHLKRESDNEHFVTRESLRDFEQGIKEMMRSFLDFFISYGLELGSKSGKNDVEALSQKLQELGSPMGKRSKA
ncbi:MAG TPA: hypothetical protein VJA25_14060 [Dehalococcoidia bacterium]|nr:hypothetical protein [Dehalococcoidia bacterium]